MDHLRRCAAYAQGILQEKTQVTQKHTDPNGLSTQQQAQIGRLVDVILAASENPVVVPFTIQAVQALADSRVSHKDQKLRERFGATPADAESDGHLPLVDQPKVYLDLEGTIIGWYLPSIFSQELSDHLMESTSKLGRQKSTVLQIQKGTTNWRYDPKSYTTASECRIPPGHVAFAPCWYELGHDHTNSQPAPSVSLRTEGGGGNEFVADEAHLNALIGAVLSIVHPEQYDMQLEVLKRLNNGRVQVQARHDTEMGKALEHWTSPFTGFAVISNRETPFHRDMKGGKLLYDLVATFGAYRGGRFEVPLFGGRYVYNPGTVFVLPGYLLEHGASRVNGDRVCLAHFVKPNVGYGAYRKYSEVALPTVELMVDRYGLAISA